MARPIKDGVMYFPFDTDFFQDDKIRMVKAEFGIKSVTVILYILCEIYRKNGYFIKWDKQACLLMSDGIGGGTSPEYISEVVHGCIRCSFFDKGVFEAFGVLTSAGIQRRYIRMLNKRSSIQLIEEYWLIDFSEEEIPSSILVKCTLKRVSGTENPVKGTENPVKGTENSQIILNQIKLNKSITGTSSRFVPPTLEQVTEYCKQRKNRVDPENWYDHYSSNGWMVGRTKMKDWKAAVRTWEKNNFSKKAEPENKKKSYDMDEVKEMFNDQ